MIYGFDDRIRIQRAGKIRLGQKIEVVTKDGKRVERPVALDYFVVPPEVAAIYGDKPRALDIMFPSDDLEEVAGTSLRWYGSSGAPKCIGDGRNASRFNDETGQWHSIVCPYQNCPVYEKGHCQEIASLRFILYKVPGAALSVYQLDTGSWNSTMNIKSTLMLLKSALGRISLIPLRLEVKMTETHPYVNGQRIKSMVPVLYLSTPFTFEQLISLARERRLVQAVNLADDGMRFQLPPVDMTKPEELYPADMNGGVIDEVPVDITRDVQSDIPADVTGDVPGSVSGDDDPIDAQLEAAWDELGTPMAKRRAILGRPDLDKVKLLATLQAEIARRRGTQVKEVQEVPNEPAEAGVQVAPEPPSWEEPAKEQEAQETVVAGSSRRSRSGQQQTKFF